MDLSQSQKPKSKTHSYFEVGSYKYNLLKEISTAGIVHLFTKTLLAPLERWRIISQLQSVYPLRPKKFTNIFNYIQRVPKQQGVLALWRGNMLHCWMYLYQLTFQTLLFDNINSMKQLWLEQSVEIPWLQKMQQNFFIPLFSSVFVLGIVYPIDTYRIHRTMSYHKDNIDAPFKTFRQFLTRIDSVKNLYRGFWLGILSSIIQFNFFKNIAGLFAINAEKTEYSQIFSPQLCISLVGVALLHPIDTFRKMVQFNNMYKPQIFSNYRACYKKLRDNKSFGSLYNGFWTSIMRVGVFIPVYWMIYKQWVQVDWKWGEDIGK